MSASSNMMKIAVVGGEGIGPEVTAQSRPRSRLVCGQAKRADGVA